MTAPSTAASPTKAPNTAASWTGVARLFRPADPTRTPERTAGISAAVPHQNNGSSTALTAQRPKSSTEIAMTKKERRRKELREMTINAKDIPPDGNIGGF